MTTKILYISTGLFHPGIKARSVVGKYLESIENISIESVSSIERLDKLEKNEYKAVVIYLHRQKISEKALRILKNYVNSGGGFLGIHSATASFKNIDEYFDILGGKFKSHEEVIDFEIKQVHGKVEIFGTVDDFTVHDEIYIHELSENIDVHFYTEVNGEKVPMVWTKNFGKGRVCYLEPGHCASSMENSSVKVIMQQAVKWIVSDE